MCHVRDEGHLLQIHAFTRKVGSCHNLDAIGVIVQQSIPAWRIEPRRRCCISQAIEYTRVLRIWTQALEPLTASEVGVIWNKSIDRELLQWMSGNTAVSRCCHSFACPPQFTFPLRYPVSGPGSSWVWHNWIAAQPTPEIVYLGGISLLQLPATLSNIPIKLG